MRIAIVLLLVARVAAADTVTVKVTEIAGGVAYLTPGRAAGLLPSAKVRLRGRDYVIFEATEQTCAIRLEGGTVAVGDASIVHTTPGATLAVKQLAKPHAPDAFKDQWPEPVAPALTQSPTAVPLGAGRATGRAHVTLIAHGYGVASKDGSAGDAEARVIASFDLMEDRPLAADLDVAGRLFSGGVTGNTATPVFVRAAMLRYGTEADPRLAIGRLRYAASAVGMLDGGRASARFGTMEIAAFGGIVPDPLGGRPDTSASRFGAEVSYDDPTAEWQPRVSLTTYGSTWSGKLDERRLAVVASAGHDAVWLDGWAEAQQFAPDNPWNAKSVELTGGGATFEYRKHGFHAGTDVTFLRPERSLRLAAALPAEWLCTLAPQPGDTPGTCSGSDYWTGATASIGTRTSSWAIDAAGSIGRTHGVYRGYDSSGYVRGEYRLGEGRVEAGAAGGHTSFASWTAGELGAGYAPTHRLDAHVLYRPELLDYAASTGPMLLHSLVADGHYAMSTMLEVALSAIATVGSDRDALAVLATLVWRPLP